MEMNLEQLNTKQLEAVKSESKRLLVLAGAGSGENKNSFGEAHLLNERKKNNSC